MKKMTILALAAALFCACQQTPRKLIQMEVPIYTPNSSSARHGKGTTQVSMVTVTGPEARAWDMFDRGDAVMKYNEMTLRDKEILFDTVARVYAQLPKNNTQSSLAINTGIWKTVSDRGVDLNFGDTPGDWHPYIMYIHPIVIAEMTNFFINARDGSISNEELDTWQKAGCNVINARPDNMCMAAMLARRNELAKAGIIITETQEGFRAHAVKVNWDKYRAEHHQL